jgi:murein DD-endopeptidase MepM/ murein hydrolase activator NlpD
MDGITIAAIAFFLFLLFNVVKDNLPESPDLSGSAVNMVLDTVQKGGKQAALVGNPAELQAEQTTQTPDSPASYTDNNGNTIFVPVPKPLNAADSAGGSLPGAIQGKQAADLNSDPGDPNAWADPYPEYIVTQGPHGQSYGHYAVDITAGKGATIYSPINGVVTALFVDQYNNTNLIIENSRYQVLFLHGNYTVQVGQELKIGDPIGTEWNNGYTLDGNGNLCAGRDCGYHTHLNIFDKSINSNIDPFTLLSH